MANITIRNIPDDIFEKIKRISSIERRSINNELLVIIEKGINSEIQDLKSMQKNISKETQLKLWKNLSSQWKDDRSTEEIIQDIYNSRTLGRDIEL